MPIIAWYWLNSHGSPHQSNVDELIAVVAKDQLSYAPSAVLYQYSGTGYMLLASIQERVSDIPYHGNLRQGLFVPIGLADTNAPFLANDMTLPPPYFEGYSRWGAEFFANTDNISNQIDPGNIISIPKDIANWVRTLLSGRGNLKKEQVARMVFYAPLPA